jgi:5'-3' exonuclease
MDSSLSESITNIVINDNNVVNNSVNDSENENKELIRIGINDYDPILFIDMSYYIFYRFFALCSWWKRAYPDEPLDIENILDNKIFINKYHKLFIENIKKITKKYRIQNANIIFAKDCRRYNIWRNKYYEDYKKSRDDKNKRFNKDIFIYTYEKIVPDLKKLDITVAINENAEADDVIAILKTVIRNRNYKIPIYIITNDHDYLQLFDDSTYIYNLKGLNLRTKSRGNSRLDLQFKIFRGDTSDNITPVVSRKIRDDKLIDIIYNEKLFNEFFKENQELKKIYDRNELLIDFNKIPKNIRDDIIKFLKFL